MNNDKNLFAHIHQDHDQDQTLFLFHGTGADEYDLLPLVTELTDTYNIVSLRGNVKEHGMNRFFARERPGVFDKESVKTEAKNVAYFLKAWAQDDGKHQALLGYSNGANIILAVLMLHPDVVSKAVLLHPMLPLEPNAVDLSDKQVLVTHGQADTMIPARESKKVIEFLQQSGVDVSVVSHGGGHEIRPQEIDAFLDFLSQTD